LFTNPGQSISQTVTVDSSVLSAGRPTRDLSFHEPVKESEEILKLRHENLELQERISQLEADQAMILDINQMLLAKLHLLSEDFLMHGPPKLIQP
jgi:hypothetical protein